MASDFAKRLKKAGSLWKTAKERAKESAGKFADFDDGRYLMRCINLALGESQNGRFQADFSWRFEEGEYEGQTKHSYQGLETEDGFTYFGRDLMRLGYEVPDDLTEEFIKEVTADIVKTKPLCRVVLKTKGEFQNLYINKLLAGGADETEEMSAADESDDQAAATDEEEEAPAAATDEEEEAPTDEEETPADEEVTLAVGMRVVASTSKGEANGEVIEILEEEGKVRVKTDDGRVVRLTVDKIEILAEAPPEEPVAKPKKAPAVPAPAPAPAKKVARKK